MRVDLHYFRNRRRGYQFDVYKRCITAFRHRNIKLQFYPDLEPRRESSSDCIIIQHYMATPATLAGLDRPIIIEESEDRSTIITREALSLKNVVILNKISVADQSYANDDSHQTQDRLFSRVEKHPKKQLPDYELSKVRPGIHFGMFDRMLPWVKSSPDINMDEWSCRPIDAMFAGRTDTYSPEINNHRKLFYKELKSINNINVICEGHRVYKLKQYRELSRNTKIIISPWGNGELCYRDFEAMFDGCILIKPKTDFIKVLGGILQADKTYIPCANDATDLKNVIHFILKNGDFFKEMRSRNRQMVLDCFSADFIASWWENQFEAISR
jgi:hypothetical protein